MKLLTGIFTSMALVLPAFAQDAGTDPSTMTCAEFVALDTAGQTSATTSIQTAAAAAASAIEEGTGIETAVEDPTLDGEATAGPDNAGADGSTHAGAAPGTDPAGGGVGDMTAALVAACSSVPDMRVTDAMMQAEASGGLEGEADAAKTDASGG